MDERDYIAMQKYLNENEMKATRERRATELLKLHWRILKKINKNFTIRNNYQNNEEGD